MSSREAVAPESRSQSPETVSWIRYLGSFRLLQPTFLLPAIALVLFLIAWEVYARATDPILFPSLFDVARAYVILHESGQLWSALVTTVGTLSIGFGLSVLVGIIGGVIVARAPLLGSVLEPYIEAIYATPRVVIVPLVILWFGIGDTGRVFLVFIGTFIPILLNTAIGVRNSRPDLIEVAQSFGASERELVRHVILPGAVPYVVAGLKIGVGRALIGVVIAEIFLDLTGIGGLIQTNAQYFRVDRMIACVLILAAMGTTLLAITSWLESRYAAWR